MPTRPTSLRKERRPATASRKATSRPVLTRSSARTRSPSQPSTRECFSARSCSSTVRSFTPAALGTRTTPPTRSSAALAATKPSREPSRRTRSRDHASDHNHHRTAVTAHSKLVTTAAERSRPVRQSSSVPAARGSRRLGHCSERHWPRTRRSTIASGRSGSVSGQNTLTSARSIQAPRTTRSTCSSRA